MTTLRNARDCHRYDLELKVKDHRLSEDNTLKQYAHLSKTRSCGIKEHLKFKKLCQQNHLRAWTKDTGKLQKPIQKPAYFSERKRAPSNAHW